MDEEKRITYDYRYGAPNSDKSGNFNKGGGIGGGGGSNMPAVTPLPGPAPEIRLPDQQVIPYVDVRDRGCAKMFRQ